MNNDLQEATNQVSAFTYYHFKIFISIFILSSIGGIAAALRRGGQVSKKELLSALLNSGLFGTIVGLLGWRFWGDEYIFFLIGFSALAGFGGTTLIDFAFQVWKRGFASMFSQTVSSVEQNIKQEIKDHDDI